MMDFAYAQAIYELFPCGSHGGSIMPAAVLVAGVLSR